jgi:hypothetical protein
MSRKDPTANIALARLTPRPYSVKPSPRRTILEERALADAKRLMAALEKL